jgi:hypothetical protein
MSLRPIRIQLRRLRRSLRKRARRFRAAALLRLFKAELETFRQSQRAFVHVDRWASTIVTIAIFAVFLFVVHEPADLETSEVHLTCAHIIGDALVLILSLSIIPAQRAAEAFSPAVLKLYAKDRWLLCAFLILASTTMGSVLLGTNFLPHMDPRLSIGIQFLLLGISFDALRMFYRRTLDLLIPQTAIQLITRECSKLQNRVGRAVERLARLHANASGGSSPTGASLAAYFSATPVSAALRYWIAQLDEIAHKLIARRDTSGANDIISAMGRIGTQYSESRRNSIALRPDFDNLFAGGVSDISDVLNPIYESFRVVCEDAAKAPNELVVRHCIQTLAGMTRHAMTMIHLSNGGWRKAPLAFSACYWLGRCTTTAVKSNMGDAILAATAGFQAILLDQKKGLDTSDLEAQSLESLATFVTASYLTPDGVWGFEAMRAMLLAARHDIELHGYRDAGTLRTVLDYARSFTPLEVAMDKARKRRLQVFPPYYLGFECSVPALLEVVARKVRVDTERPINPFHEFLKAAEDVRGFYRELSKTDFENTLLQKWVIDSLMAAARVHWAIVVSPLAGTEAHIDDVDESLRWLVSWVSAYFPEREHPYGLSLIRSR